MTRFEVGDGADLRNPGEAFWRREAQRQAEFSHALGLLSKARM